MGGDAVDALLADLVHALETALGDRLLAVHLTGSLVTGDFAPQRSDVDLLAVLADDPDERLLGRLRPELDRVERQHPAWTGRIEVELVSVAAVAAGAAGRLGAEPHPLARVSPGEALHLLAATRHRVLGWAAAREHGRALPGPAPQRLLPPVEAAVVRAALLDHVRDWPVWVRDMRTTGGQVYAVLTTCRALVRLRDDDQLSKRQAADRVIATAEAGEADVVRWARDWWYGCGADHAPSRTDEVVAFVERVAAVVLAAERRRSAR